MALQTELDTFRTSWEARVGEQIAAMMTGDIEVLRHSGLLERAAKPGDLLPHAPGLVDSHGAPFDLATLAASVPTIITFYRGGWCPYCNIELRAYQALLPDIHAAGGQLVAISPELPDYSMTTAEKNDLTYAVVSDVGGHFASSLGIRFTLSETVRPFYERAGHALPTRNGDGVWALPMPATFVVDKGGIIAASFIEPDYRRRLDPREALAALELLAAKKAA